jgi:HEAT repeat protein
MIALSDILTDVFLRGSLLGVLLAIVGALFVVTLVCATYALVLRRRNEIKDRRRAHYARMWTDRLIPALMDEAEATSLQQSVQESDRLPFVGFAVQYARRLRGEGRDALVRIVRPFLGPVLERAESRRVEVRARAIQTLGTLGLPEHAHRVIAALDDPSPLVAMVAARALATQESPEYAEAVLARLHRFNGWNQRFLASMLASMGPGIAPTLRSGLADALNDPRSRAVLAEALRIQGDLGSGDAAAEVLRSSSDPELLASALRLLRDVGRPEHVDAVRPHTRSSDWGVRAQALHTLGAVGGADDLPALLEGMQDESPWAALSAAKGVLAAGGPAALTDIAANGQRLGVLARQVLAGETR